VALPVCVHLKTELQKVQDKLKTSHLVIYLLQKEIMSKNVLGCINTWEQESRANWKAYGKTWW
jgi:hypothetical protein